MNSKKVCPFCKHILYKRYEGLVCKNHTCKMYHKLGKGWVYQDKTEDKFNKFSNQYYYNLKKLENQKIFLHKKRICLIKHNNKCKICDSEGILEIHHIIPVSEAPELTLDIDNMIPLCKDCHLKIHSKDKYKYSKKRNIE